MNVENNPYGTPAENPSSNSAALYGATRSVMIRRVSALSVGKVLGGLYALIGLIIGGVFTLVALLGVAVGGGAGLDRGLISGLGAIILLPIVYGVMGLIGGLIVGVLYNFVAGLTGGIVVDLES